MGVRLRQAVVVAGELGPVAERLRAELGLGEPFADPAVGMFGLRNAVFALGDAFLEVVSPVQDGTAAGRQLERRGGDGGYMLIFQLDDLAGARARAAELGVRAVWEVDLPDISATHLHPADMRGAIVSIDRPLPPESWRWGGPDWTGRAGTGAPVEEGTRLALDGGSVRFTPAAEPSGEALVEVALELPADARGGREAVEIAGVRFTLAEAA